MKKYICLIAVTMAASLISFSHAYASNWMSVDKSSVDTVTGNKIGNYYFQLDENYDENYKMGLEYSENGKNFAQLDLVRTNSYPQYSNGLYFVVDNSLENVPVNKRYVGFENSPTYVLDSGLNIINTISDKCYVQYLGYFDGYHYLDFTYYVSNNSNNAWESMESGHLYKTQDGVNLQKVSEDEDLSFLSGKVLYNNDILFTVYDEKNEEFNTLSTPSGIFEVLFENDYHQGYIYNKTIPLMSMYAVVGEKTVTAADGREYRESIEKKYLTMDGVYGVEMPDDIGRYCFEINGNYYFEKDEDYYYCISASELKNKIKVVYDNNILAFATPPVTEADRTLVPMRFLFEQMGADVEWDSATQTAIVKKQNEIITFSIDNTAATVNGVQKTMDVPARLINDKTLVPLRFLSEELGFNVEWNEAERLVTISK